MTSLLRKRIRSILVEAKGWWDERSESDIEEEEALYAALVPYTKIRVTGTADKSGIEISLTAIIKEVIKTKRQPGMFWSGTYQLGIDDGYDSDCQILPTPHSERTKDSPGPFLLMTDSNLNYESVFNATVEIIWSPLP